MIYKPQKILSTAINRLIKKEPFWARLIASLKIETVPGEEVLLKNLTVLVGEEKIKQHTKEDNGNLQTEELETIILGTILKIGLLHMIRGRDKDPELWNAACNIYISNLLSREKYKLPDDVAPIIAEFNLIDDDEETIYEKLASQRASEISQTENSPSPLKENASEGEEGDSHRESTETEDNNRDSSNQPGPNQETKADKTAAAVNNTMGRMQRQLQENNPENNEYSDVQNISQNREEPLSDEKIEKIVQQAIMMGQKAGDTPSYLGEKITNLRKTNFNLRNIIEKFAHSCKDDRYNWMKPERRHHDSDFLIPSITGENFDICIAFDTSGSCYDIVKRILGVIYEVNEAIYGEPEPIHLLYCDCGKPQHQIWRKKTDFPQIENAGGGTSFRPVMDWIITQNKKEPEKIKNLLYITDGECNDYGKNPQISVTWLILDIFGTAKEAAKAIPFGKKIIISKEQIRKFMAR
jgi:predicted metal-dependent peptidase